MLVVNELPRTFKFKFKGEEITLSDPNPNLSPQQVLSHYTPMYSFLAVAKIKGPEVVEDKLEFRFVSTIGTKS